MVGPRKFLVAARDSTCVDCHSMPIEAPNVKRKRTKPAGSKGDLKVSFGISVSMESAVAIDTRVEELTQTLGVPMTRSAYLELLARHDRQHQTIEEILARPALAAG